MWDSLKKGLAVLAEALAIGGENWGAFLRGGAVSAQRRTDASTVESGKSRVKSP